MDLRRNPDLLANLLDAAADELDDHPERAGFIANALRNVAADVRSPRRFLDPPPRV